MSLTTNTGTPAGGKLCGTCGTLLQPLTKTIANTDGPGISEAVVKIVGYICPNDPSHMP